MVWAPFFILRIAGESPALMVFLPFHLAGVFSGARLRTVANQQLGRSKAKRSGYKRISHIMVIASILVWIPYYVQKFSGYPVALDLYLTLHLVGILSGIGLNGAESVWQSYQKRRTQKIIDGHKTSKDK